MRPAPAQPGLRRGMTFLEVVAATALMAIVAASIFGVFGFVAASQSRDMQKLAAMEVANRLILAYLDDPVNMPDPNKTVDYGPPEAPLRFRWDYREEPVVVVEAAADQRDRTRQSPLTNDRFRQVTVRVWLSEQSGGARRPDVSTPMATLTRMLDPVAPRNPDSFMNMLQDPRGFEELMRRMMGVQGGSTLNTGGGQEGRRGSTARPLRGGGGLGPREAFQQGRGRSSIQTGRPGGGGRLGGGAGR